MVSTFCRLIVIVTTLSASYAVAQTTPKPALNVVLITIDTLRADHLGCYGYRQIKTPNIDGLAADGARFDRAFAVVPVTLPSHTSILTGTYPMFSGMHDFSGNKLSPQQPTLASVLKQAGYQTGAVIGAAVLDSRFGLNQGFDFYYDHFDFSRLDEANLDQMERPGNIVADTALDWLAKNSQKKFFLWMHLYDPHFPYRPPEPYSREYAAQPYDGEIAFADEQVGRLIRFLKEKGIYQNTVIVLCGDHGESLGEHGEKTHGFFIYNATMHVPLIIRLPANGTTHVVSDPVSLVDLMPTVLELSPAQQAVFSEIAGELQHNGFEAEPFGARSVAVKVAPAGVDAAAVEHMLHELLDQISLEEQSLNLEKIRGRIAASIACHAAIKVNMPLEQNKMDWLLAELAKTDHPMSCPHGRPVVLRYSVKDIQKAFKRI